MASAPHEVTQLLHAWHRGDEVALARLVVLVEAELHRLAEGYLRHEHAVCTLQPTALVNEAWLRLLDWQPGEWQNRAHFLGTVAGLMRRVLVDHARRRHALRHGGDALRVSFAEAEQWPDAGGADVLTLHEALERLATFDARKSQIVELRFFGGLTEEQTAAALDLSTRTLRREWRLARVWLYNELKK